MARDSKDMPGVESPEVKAPEAPKAGQTEAGIHSMQGLGAGGGESIEAQEEARMDAAVTGILQIDELKRENWSHLDDAQRRIALDRAGRELMHAYGPPGPPLIIGEQANKGALGSYSDEDYLATINRAGEPHRDGKPLGDNAEESLKTYAHEWRHTYQHQQAETSTKPQFRNMVHDQEQAERWRANIADYQNAPPDELAQTDPEAYSAQFARYERQPIETDARSFASRLVRKVYGS